MTKPRSVGRRAQQRERTQQNREAAQRFAELLRSYRAKRKCSLRQFGMGAGVPHQWVDEMERGQRPCGPRAAERLAGACLLIEDTDEYKNFLYAAAATMKVARFIAESRDFPPQVLDAVASRLREQGIRGFDVINALIYSPEGRAINGGVDLELTLRNKSTLRISITIEKH
jgi:transcriptional regulator with XRE-family HTH domain